MMKMHEGHPAVSNRSHGVTWIQRMEPLISSDSLRQYLFHIPKTVPCCSDCDAVAAVSAEISNFQSFSDALLPSSRLSGRFRLQPI